MVNNRIFEGLKQLFSTTSSMGNKRAIGLVGSAVLTYFSVLLVMMFDPSFQISSLELFAVFTSYFCTWLCVIQDRWNYVVGVITTAAYSLLFYQLGVYGSAALNAYLVPTLAYGWFRWGHNDNSRPVTHVSRDLKTLSQYAGFTVLAVAFVYGILRYFDATLGYLDAWILVFSIIAQFLLDNKKIETWYLWAAVNVIAIFTYFGAGAPFAGIQYVVFLGNTVYGYLQWKKTMRIAANETTN